MPLINIDKVKLSDPISLLSNRNPNISPAPTSNDILSTATKGGREENQVG